MVPYLVSILMLRSEAVEKKLGRRKQALSAADIHNHLVGWMYWGWPVRGKLVAIAEGQVVYPCGSSRKLTR